MADGEFLGLLREKEVPGLPLDTRSSPRLGIGKTGTTRSSFNSSSSIPSWNVESFKQLHHRKQSTEGMRVTRGCTCRTPSRCAVHTDVKIWAVQSGDHPISVHLRPLSLFLGGQFWGIFVGRCKLARVMIKISTPHPDASPRSTPK